MKIELLKPTHSFSCNCYLVSSDGEYAVIDPTTPFDPDLCQGSVKYILLTHAHFDHILEIDSWVRGTGAPVITSVDEKDALSDPMRNCYKLFDGTDRGYFGEVTVLEEGKTLPLGDREISIINCPGHTIGSATYLIGNSAFVGDTIFAGGGYGRFDLPTGNFIMLKDSIRRLMTLPDETVVYPGHGESTTIKQYFRR